MNVANLLKKTIDKKNKMLKRPLFFVLLLWIAGIVNGQGADQGLEIVLKQFHQSMILKNVTALNQHTDKILSYGHSNGWIETKADFLNNLKTGYISYQSYKEDSVNIVVNDNMANARFVADINVTMDGKTNVYHLKVLEVWVKKGKRWVLFARQAVR